MPTRHGRRGMHSATAFQLHRRPCSVYSGLGVSGWWLPARRATTPVADHAIQAVLCPRRRFRPPAS